MIIKPKFRGFVCTTAHPIGCEKNVLEQIDYVKKQGKIDGVKNALIIGASTGYGLASRITAAFGCKANTIGLFFEKEASGKRTATPGWYNSLAFDHEAKKDGLISVNINGDAYSNEIKEQTIETIKALPGGKVDLVIYSLAAPRKTDPVTGETYSSVIKPVGSTFKSKTVDFHTADVSNVEIEPATTKEVADTIQVMGGSDWLLWMDVLNKAGVLDDGVKTVAYSYIGPTVTHPIYKDGSIGLAKKDLEETVGKIDKTVDNINGKAYVSVNKGLVTQASSAIPVVPLYISLLYKVMKEAGTHEGCIEQMYRLFDERLYTESGEVPVDEKGRIRIDDLEMDSYIQAKISELWPLINSDNILELCDLAGFRSEFFKLFGFGREDVDYEIDVEA